MIFFCDGLFSGGDVGFGEGISPKFHTWLNTMAIYSFNKSGKMHELKYYYGTLKKNNLEVPAATNIIASQPPPA